MNTVLLKLTSLVQLALTRAAPSLDNFIQGTVLLNPCNPLVWVFKKLPNKVQQRIRKIRSSYEYTKSKYHSDLDRDNFMTLTLIFIKLHPRMAFIRRHTGTDLMEKHISFMTNILVKLNFFQISQKLKMNLCTFKI